MAELYLSDGSKFSKIPLLTETVTTDTNLDNHTKTGYYVVRGVPSTGGNASSPVNQWVSVFTDADIGTPFQIAIPDGASSYLYKRALNSSTWHKMSAGYADTARSATTATTAATANAVAWNNISGKPNTYTPSSHTHTKSQISDFPSKLEPYFANDTWYVVGDDAAIGDHNKGGAFCIKGLNGTPNVSLYNSDDSYYGQCITSADIGSQSVKYATTAGSANTEYSVQVSSTQPTDSRCKLWIKI